MRDFDSGATRDDADDKVDYEGFLSYPVLTAFGEYMHRHRKQADGELRAADNWQKGIPKSVYMSSLWRHFVDLWALHRGYTPRDRKDGHKITVEEACCAILFNVQGYLHEELGSIETLTNEPVVRACVRYTANWEEDEDCLACGLGEQPYSRWEPADV